MPQAAGTKVLTQGLEILGLLAESAEPMSATAVAERCGVSVSTASRVLSGLAAAGYVRRPSYRSFAVDLGALALAGNARSQFPVEGARPVLTALAARCVGGTAVLGTLHRGQLVYFLQVSPGREPVELSVGRYPLHLSSIALALLADRPRTEALAALRASRRRYGWERPGPEAPADEEACLMARPDAQGVLRLAGWQAAGRTSAACRVPAAGWPDLGLALVGPEAAVDRALGHLPVAGRDLTLALSRSAT